MNKIWSFDSYISSDEEWQRKYHGCYVEVIFQEGGNLIANLSIRDGGSTTHITDVQTGNRIPITVPISRWLPKAGWAYTGKGLLVFVSRRPARQWRRSFCEDMYAVNLIYTRQGHGSILDSTVIGSLHKGISKISFCPADIQKIDKKYSGAPLSETLAVQRFEESTWQLVGPTGLLGYVNVERGVIFAYDSIFQELHDLETDFKWTITKM